MSTPAQNERFAAMFGFEPCLHEVGMWVRIKIDPQYAIPLPDFAASPEHCWAACKELLDAWWTLQLSPVYEGEYQWYNSKTQELGQRGKDVGLITLLQLAAKRASEKETA